MVVLLLAVGCAQPPLAPPVQTPPPFEVPIPVPPTSNPTPIPIQPVLYVTVSLTAYMAPHWFANKLPHYAYYLEWQNPDGSWRSALTSLDTLGEGWVGSMSEAQPSITRRLPVGNYRVAYGFSKGEFAY